MSPTVTGVYPPSSRNLSQRNLVIVMNDLAGYANAYRRLDDLHIAQFLDAYYETCARLARQHNGRIVKFMGDGCLCVFEPEHCVNAVEFGRALLAEIPPVAKVQRADVDVGVINIHMATVVEGEFGEGDSRRYDIIGSGVNHVFLMGRGKGFNISEPVYRQLPSAARTPWQKNKPPVTYTLQG